MTKQKAATAFSDLTEAFGRLNLDEKAAFLVKAAFSTASTALDDIGERIEEMINSLAVPSEPEKEGDGEAPQNASSTGPDTPPSP